MAQDQVLKEVAAQVAECKRCQLNYSRKKSVPGEGPAHAEIMMIGEGPGFYENEQGRPFVGPSGKYLDELLEKGGVSRKDVFITNVVKCRPPGNRDPLPEELQSCGEYLDRQIAAIDPLIIITLGRFSMGKFLYNAKISEVHGRPVWVRGRLIIPMFHPAAALHQLSLKTTLEQDFARLPEFIQQARSGNGRPALKAQPETPKAQVEAAPAQPDQPAILPGSPAAPEEEAAPVKSSGAPVGEQQSLFGDLFAAPPLENPEPKKEEDPSLQKGQPTQLSLF